MSLFKSLFISSVLLALLPFTIVMTFLVHCLLRKHVNKVYKMYSYIDRNLSESEHELRAVGLRVQGDIWV